MLKKLLLTLLASFALWSGAWAAVDLNTATQAQLETLNGIGPAKAKDIVDYRSKNGAFKAPEDVMKVPGIKEGTYNKIKSEITVNGKVAAATPKAEKTSKASSSAKAEKASRTASKKASAPAKSASSAAKK